MHGGDFSTVGSRLRLAMSARKVTVHGLAGLTGYAASTVQKYRNNNVSPSVAIVVDFAQALGVRPSWLAFNDGEME